VGAEDMHVQIFDHHKWAMVVNDFIIMFLRAPSSVAASTAETRCMNVNQLLPTQHFFIKCPGYEILVHEQIGSPF